MTYIFKCICILLLLSEDVKTPLPIDYVISIVIYMIIFAFLFMRM